MSNFLKSGLFLDFLFKNIILYFFNTFNSIFFFLFEKVFIDFFFRNFFKHFFLINFLNKQIKYLLVCLFVFFNILYIYQ